MSPISTFTWPDVSSCTFPYTSLKRTFGYCLRFANNCKNDQKRTGPLTFNEMKNAEVTIIKLVQGEQYVNEINALRKNKSIKKCKFASFTEPIS